jgi:hypothetical protein
MLVAILAAAPAMPLLSLQANAQNAPPAPPPPGASRPDFCTEQYDPVCGRLGDVSKTYSNACFARMAGATVVTVGPCSDDKAGPSPK